MALHLLAWMKKEELLCSSEMQLLYEILSPEKKYNWLAVSMKSVMSKTQCVAGLYTVAIMYVCVSDLELY